MGTADSLDPLSTMAVKQDSDTTMAVQGGHKEDHEFFTRMLDLIPTNFYFDNESKKFLRDDQEDSKELSDADVEQKKQKQQQQQQNDGRLFCLY